MLATTPKITVIDALMGFGKTQYMIRRMNEAQDRYHASMFSDADTNANRQPPRFIYITPFLEEASRIAEACPTLRFYEPLPIGGRKLEGLKDKIAEGANIASTHALFMNIDREAMELLKGKGYTLIIDEELECVRKFEITKTDVETLFERKFIYVEESTRRLRWSLAHQGYRGRFDDVKNLCDSGHLVYYKNTIIIWELPLDLLPLFSETIILTYLFEGSLMSAYLKANGIPYDVMTLNTDRKLVPINERNEEEIKRRLSRLVTVNTDRALNEIGTKVGKRNPLSSSWFDTDQKHHGRAGIERLRRCTETFFRHHVNNGRGGCVDDNMWTSFKAVSGKLKGRGYARAWTQWNLRATNDYRHKKNLAYLCNTYLHPMIHGYLDDCGVKVSHDLYALSSLVQWVWRSQIRDGKPITVYVPSERMRGLFLDWLSNKPLPKPLAV